MARPMSKVEVKNPKAKGGVKVANIFWLCRVRIEMRSRREKLGKHYDQLFDYWSHSAPKRPPIAIPRPRQGR